MAKTARDAYKHAEALSSLFADSQEVAEVIVRSFLDSYKKRKYLKQSLRRMIQRGLIDKKPTKYIVTKEGVQFFQHYFPIANVTPPKDWDGKWRIISFDVPGEYRVERTQIRTLLKEFNFYCLHKSVWASPSYLSQDFWKALVDTDLHVYSKAMLVEILEGDEELRKYFGLPLDSKNKK